MSEKYKFNDLEGIYFMTTTVVGWIDLFTRPELKHVIFPDCQNLNFWCLEESSADLLKTLSIPALGD